jgi:hypothetical protein
MNLKITGRQFGSEGDVFRDTYVGMCYGVTFQLIKYENDLNTWWVYINDSEDSLNSDEDFTRAIVFIDDWCKRRWKG